jgi:hypothetical protein
MLRKEAIHQEEITIINLYVSNVGTPNFIEYTIMDLKSRIDPNTVVVGDYHQWISHPDKKWQKRILEFNDNIDLMFTEYSILQHHNIYSSPQPMEFFPK